MRLFLVFIEMLGIYVSINIVQYDKFLNKLKPNYKTYSILRIRK